MSMPSPLTSKRPAENNPSPTVADPSKKQKATQPKPQKKKANEDNDNIGLGDRDAGAPRISYFEEKKETDLLLKDIEKHRRQPQTGVPIIENTQLLSEWRMAYEVIRQKQGKGIETPGFDPKIFDIIQCAYRLHMQEVLLRATAMAKYRVQGSQRPQDFITTSDLRRGLGTIRKRDEMLADAKANAEREALLRAAGSKRADEETRERAQRAKLEIAGQQQALAANKALAAAAGADVTATWASWTAPAPTGAAGGAGGQKQKQAGKGKGGKTIAAASGSGPIAGDDGSAALVIQSGDMIAALEQDPLYGKSPMLYELLNSSS